MAKHLGFRTVPVVVALAAVACQSAAGQKVAANQHFLGLVNGKNTAAQIRVACAGPTVVGRTTHPLAGQTLSVTQVSSGGGYTGSAASAIFITIGSATNTASLATFTDYDATQPIPTTLTVPCEGTGQISFSTCFDVVPCTSTAKASVVTVTFVNLAA